MASASVPYSFSNGTASDGSQVNANFAALVAFVNNSTAHLDGSGSFTGIPNLPAVDPTSANQATRKAYVDAQVATAVSAANAGGTAGAAALNTHKTSSDHDGRYYTETEIDARVADMGRVVGAAKVIRLGQTSVVFSGASTSNTVTVSVSGASGISKVFVQPLGAAVATAVSNIASGSFQVQGSTIDFPYSGTVVLDYMVVSSS